MSTLTAEIAYPEHPPAGRRAILGPMSANWWIEQLLLDGWLLPNPRCCCCFAKAFQFPRIASSITRFSRFSQLTSTDTITNVNVKSYGNNEPQRE